MRLFSRLLICLIMAIVVSGCASKKTPPKESDESGTGVKLAFIVDKGVNKDLDGRPSPIRVDFFQLTSAEEFENADYFALVNQPKEVLADKLLQKDQFVLRPEELKEVSVKLDSKTKYVGVVASYREIDSKVWSLAFTATERPWYRPTSKHYLYLSLDDEIGLKHIDSKAYKVAKKEKQAQKKREKEKRAQEKAENKNNPDKKGGNGVGAEDKVVDEGFFILKNAR